MIYLQVNNDNQFIYLSLDEARQYYATPYTHYLFVLIHEENSTTGQELAQVATIVNENVRITQSSAGMPASAKKVERGSFLSPRTLRM